MSPLYRRLHCDSCTKDYIAIPFCKGLHCEFVPKEDVYAFGPDNPVRSRGVWPNNFEYFGKIKTLKRAEKSVEDHLNTLGHKAEDYFLEDNEHFNKQYHDLVAKEYLSWLKE